MLLEAVMFVERLKTVDIENYLLRIVLRDEEFDSMRICEIHNWSDRLGNIECKQVKYQLNMCGETQCREYDVLDFEMDLHHCRFMLERFGEEYLSYLHSVVRESGLSEAKQTKFLAQNTKILAGIEKRRTQIKTDGQKSLFDKY